MKEIIQTNAKIYIAFVLTFMVILAGIPDKPETTIPVALGAAVLYGLYIIVCLLMSIKNFFQGNKEEGFGFLKSSLLLMLIGSPLCYGALILGNTLNSLVK